MASARSPRRCCGSAPTTTTAGSRPCPEPPDPHRVGRKGRAEGGLCPSLLAADGAAAPLWRLLHLQEHGAGERLPLGRAEVPHRRSRLPDPEPAAVPLHALLLLHSRRGTGAGGVVRGVLSALCHHLLP